MVQKFPNVDHALKHDGEDDGERSHVPHYQGELHLQWQMKEREYGPQLL